MRYSIIYNYTPTFVCSLNVHERTALTLQQPGLAKGPLLEDPGASPRNPAAAAWHRPVVDLPWLRAL
jgi:hypothetical protein